MGDHFLPSFETKWDPAIAQWIRLRLPSCCPGFKSHAHHIRFFNLYCSNCIFVIWIEMWKERALFLTNQGEMFFKKWIRLHLTFFISCRPGFKSQARHLLFLINAAIENGPFPSYFVLFSSFLQTVSSKLFNKSCRWQETNPGPLVSEVTALSTVSQLLPNRFY